VHRLRRLCPSIDGFSFIDSIHGDTQVRSIAPIGSLLCATLPLRDLESLESKSRAAKYDLTVHDVIRVHENEVEANVILEYIRSGDKKPVPAPIPLDKSIRHYIVNPTIDDSEAKESVVAFMSPIIEGAYAPKICKSNEEYEVKARVFDAVTIGAKQEGDRIPKVVQEAAAAFIAMFIDENHYQKAHPCSIEEVYTRQPKPTQRAKLDHADPCDPIRIIRNFQKKETYSSIKPPRPISEPNATDKLQYAQFIYVLMQHMKSCPWYAFGKSNADVARRVADICKFAQSIMGSDFSFYDGTIGWILREFELSILLALFHPIYHAKIRELHKADYDLDVVCPLGTKYHSDTARFSGTLGTAAFNSLINALWAFICKWIEYRGDPKYRAKYCWNSLGVYGGDDGNTADIKVQTAEKVAALLGLKVKASSLARGSPGVTFLSRVYSPNVWNGDVNSCTVLLRQLLKLHVTPHLPPNVTPRMKAIEKARAYYQTDPGAPVLGDWSAKVLSLCPIDTELTSYLDFWNARPEAGEQYLCVREDWMFDTLTVSIPELDFKGLIIEINKATTVEELLNLRSFCTPRPPSAAPVTTLVNDEQLFPGAPDGKSGEKPKGHRAPKTNKPKEKPASKEQPKDVKPGKERKPNQPSRKERRKQRAAESSGLDFVSNVAPIMPDFGPPTGANFLPPGFSANFEGFENPIFPLTFSNSGDLPPTPGIPIPNLRPSV